MARTWDGPPRVTVVTGENEAVRGWEIMSLEGWLLRILKSLRIGQSDTAKG